MQHEVTQRPDFAMVNIQLGPGEQLQAEPSAMVSMTPGMALKAALRGGIFKSVMRAFGGESLVMNTFTAPRQGGAVSLAPATMGDVVHYPLERGQELYIQRGGYVASSPGVTLSASWQGARGFFSGEGLVLLKATGEGDLFFSTYGGLLEMDVDGETVVDTGYVVAFENTLHYSVGAMPGVDLKARIKTFIFGGEALICRFSGRGRVWVQTRAVRPFLRWVWPFRPVKRNNA